MLFLAPLYPYLLPIARAALVTVGLSYVAESFTDNVDEASDDVLSSVVKIGLAVIIIVGLIVAIPLILNRKKK